MIAGRLLPFGLLLAYGAAFGAAAFGLGLPAFDDHPGQLFRLWHLLRRGPAPWAWNPDWWTGYPELQFYPPGFFYVGELLHALALGRVPVTAVYQALLWITWLAPGVTTFWLLARLLRSGWLGLPGAFVALTLSAGLPSGVEGGVRVGMLPARLGWALLPLLPLLLDRWLADTRRGPWAVAPLLAVIVLLHPAHAPVAIVLLALGAWVGAGPRAARLSAALGVLALAVALTAFWTLPLTVNLAHTRALAWGRWSVAGILQSHPLALALLGLAVAALRAGDSTASLVGRWPWAALAAFAADAAVLEPLGLRWLPAHRLNDSLWLTVVLAASLAAGRGLERLRTRARLPRPALALAAVALAVALSLPGRTLALWPRPVEWPSWKATVRGLRLDDLWALLRQAPPGRVLFVRSGLPLAYGTEWWRPHSHITALTPVEAGRAIVHGTFTHPSPTAALVYRGDAGPGPIRMLAEELDGRALFGQPIERLDWTTFNRYADPLGVGVVVALDEDVPRLRALESNPLFMRQPAPPPHVVYFRRLPLAVPEAAGPGRLRIRLDADQATWQPARLAYYPLWRAEADGRALPTRRGQLGDLEVLVPGGPATVELTYGPGGAELTGLALSALGLLAWAGVAIRARGRE